MNAERPDWNTYFMQRARLTATRATCPRRSVGAVFVRDHREVSSGYNGSRTGAPHCTDVGCFMHGGHCRRTVHAEMNALVTAARHGTGLRGSTLYVTTLPCWNCFQAVVQAGVGRIFWCDDYDHEEAQWVKSQGGVYLERLEDD